MSALFRLLLLCFFKWALLLHACQGTFFQVHHIFVQFRGFFLLARGLRFFQLSTFFMHRSRLSFSSPFFDTPFLSSHGNRKCAITDLWSLSKCTMSVATASVQSLVFRTRRSEGSLLVGIFLAPHSFGSSTTVSYKYQACWILPERVFQRGHFLIRHQVQVGR